MSAQLSCMYNDTDSCLVLLFVDASTHTIALWLMNSDPRLCENTKSPGILKDCRRCRRCRTFKHKDNFNLECRLLDVGDWAMLIAIA